LDRPKRGGEGKEDEVVEAVVVEEEAAAGGVGMFVHSAVILEFGCTGGGSQSLVAMMRSVIQSRNPSDVEAARTSARWTGD
jgi:predicted Ser/Thr protein kinase